MNGFSFVTNKNKRNIKSTGIMLSVSKGNKAKDGVMSYQFNVTFYSDTVDKFHMKKGDRISFGFDATGRIAIIDNDEGYLLSVNQKTLKIGGVITKALPSYINRDTPSIYIPIEEIGVEKNMLVLDTKVSDFSKTERFPKI